MCGLLYSNDSSVEKDSFLRALRLMEHRGPDAPGGYFRKNNHQFGHNRLKILDLNERSNQPFVSKCGRYIIVFNGEIYNYLELKKKYCVETKTTSDTEVLVELFAMLGEKMLIELNGMFAFVIFDTETDHCFIARDRLGIKPLYIYTKGEKIIISSEIAPLVMLVNTTRIDEIGLRQYKKLRTFFNGRTIYSEIKMFPAGNYFYNDKFNRYWEISFDEKESPEDEEIYELLKSAVEYRCLSDVPVGSYLSGGLDSSILAGLASKSDTWTVGFSDFNEFEWGRMAADNIKSIHNEVVIGYEEFLNIVDNMVEKRKEPLSVPNEVLLYKMTKAVKTKNTVVLSGEGADELFFGYDRIFKWASEEKWSLEEFTKYYSYGSLDDQEIVEDALSPFLYLKKPIKIVSAFFQIAHLHGLLRRLDNSTMMCSVEARVPFVDHRLIELMAGVTYEARTKDGVPKAQLKRKFRYFLPDGIINRAKVGFPVPLEKIYKDYPNRQPMDSWFEHNLKVLGI